jgi:hypothetical protein
MKNKFLVLGLVITLGFIGYFQCSPRISNFSTLPGKMGTVLEQQFHCEIKSTSYDFKNWHHSLTFELDEDSKHSVSNEEARAFLAANFPEFRFVDEFQLD